VVGRRRYLNASFLILCTVPPIVGILEALNSNLHSAVAAIPSSVRWLLPVLTRLKDTELVLPINLVRAFWASAAISLAQSLFLACCPRVLREYDDFDEWRQQDAAAIDREVELSNRLGATKEFEIVRTLKQDYSAARADAARTHLVARALVALMYAVGAWLSVLVLANQLKHATRGLSFVQVFLW
jgi:hypothetical protein